jgi:hypothetical protein
MQNANCNGLDLITDVNWRTGGWYTRKTVPGSCKMSDLVGVVADAVLAEIA